MWLILTAVNAPIPEKFRPLLRPGIPRFFQYQKPSKMEPISALQAMKSRQNIPTRNSKLLQINMRHRVIFKPSKKTEKVHHSQLVKDQS